MKYLCKCVFLCLGLLVMTFSCQKEDINNDTTNLQEKGVNNDLFRKGKLSDYKHVSDFVATIKVTQPIQNGLLGRTAFETSNGFTILEHQDIAIHSGDVFNTYTIPVVKNQQPLGSFTNLVVQFSVASDSTSAYLLTYLPNPGYLEAYATNNQTAFSGQVTYESLDYDGSLDDLNARMVCHNINVSYCNWGGETHAAGEGCTASFMWTETYNICYESNDGFGSGTETIEPPEGPRGGGTSGDTTNTPNTGSSTSTIPADVVSEVTSILNLNELNDQATISWLNDPENFTEVINIFLFLEENTDAQGNADQEAIDFVEEAIEIIEQDNGIEFEDLVTIHNEMHKKCQALVLFRSILKVNSTFTNMIKENYLKSSDNDIIMKDLNVGEGDSPLVAGSGANTDPNPDINADTNADIINIQFNNTYISQATNLGYVATFYHELLHAHIYHLYHDGELLTEYPNYTALKTALDDWFSNPNDATKEDLANEEMHNIYVDFIDDIADSLAEYCSVNNISGVDLIYAKKLVWGGLNGYDVFQNNLTQAERDEAQTLLAYENFNHTQHAKSPKTCN